MGGAGTPKRRSWLGGAFPRHLSLFLHELSSYALIGGFAAQLVLASASVEPSPESSRLITLTALWVTAPALFLVVGSGFLAMIVSPVFFKKGWVWLKILLTLPPTYAVIATLPFYEQGLTAGVSDQLTLALLVSIVVLYLSIWRPRSVLSID